MRLQFWLDRLFGRGRLDGAMDEEMRFHLAERAAELRRAGVPDEEAERRARLEFGGVESYKEQCRETMRLHLLHEFVEDLRFGLRLLRRAPGVYVVALFCLTIGIGANAAVWSWIEGILLRPFPVVAHQERLMAMAGTYRGAASESDDSTDVSWPDFVDMRRSCTACEAFIADKIMSTTLSVGDRAETAIGSVVSANYFQALGVRPMLGRGFTPEEEVGRNAHPVTVISYQLWRDRFRGDPNIVGKTQLFNGLPHTIVGVAPKGFYGTFVGWGIQFWVPVSMQETFDPAGSYKLEDRGARWIEGFVQLKPGVSAAQAQAEITAAAGQLASAYPATNRGRGVRLYPLWQTPFNGARTLLPTLSVALAVVVFVLLIACANVGNLLLVRGLARRHELTVRLAVGARRGRLVRQLLTEGLVLSALAAAGGLVFANWCRNLLMVLLPSRGRQIMNLPGAIDWRVLSLSVGVALIATLLFGLLPAMQASNINLATTLNAEAAAVVGGRRRKLARSSLVLVQVALSFVLLVGAGLLLRSLNGMEKADPGFSTRHVLATFVDFQAAGYSEQRVKNFQDRLIERLQSVPGVESAAFARILPFEYRTYSSAPVAVDAYETPADEQPTVDYDEIGPGYLATLGIPVVEGREFTRADNETAPPVAVVNQAMAAQFWRGQDPVGRRLQVKGRWMQVVGVARTAKYRTMNESPTPFFYVAMRQNAAGQALTIRTSLPPESLAQTLAREVHALDDNLAPGSVVTLRTQVERTLAPQRVAVLMLSVFGALALVLAAVGLYGVMSYTVSQSRRELGLRMALGARPADVLRVVLSYGLGLTVAGVAVGATVALISSRLLGYLLYRVSPRDPVAFGSALLVMVIASVAACLAPARRAARIDPARALRN